MREWARQRTCCYRQVCGRSEPEGAATTAPAVFVLLAPSGYDLFMQGHALLAVHDGIGYRAWKSDS